MKKIITLVLFILSTTISAQDENLVQLAKHERWLRLLHYRVPMWGKRVSIIDNVHFFFSSTGDESPIDELNATISSFQNLEYDKKKFKWHPQCAYPARLKFLKANTRLQFPTVECEDFDWWKKRVNAKSISLVFSSYYTGNPASMFGHTLIKFNTDKGEGKISDFTFNFAASAGADKGLTYIFKGLTGGFRGTFSTEPYYVKINDYIQGESRDVWEYLLDLNDDEVDWIVKHAWELKTNAVFDYFFLDENCSYILLAVIDVARLDWHTSKGFYYYTLPVTTIKRVDEANGIKSRFYRASFRKKMLERVRLLNPEQKKHYFNLLNDKEILVLEKDKSIMEAYISFLRYKQYEEGDEGVQIKTIKSDLRTALIFRARLGGKTEPVEENIRKRNLFDDPRNSHKTYTMHMKYGEHSLLKGFAEFNFRFGVHDIMNNGLGLPRYSNIDILSFYPRYYLESKKLRINRIKFIDMMTLINFDMMTKDLSWGIRIELEQPRDFLTPDVLLHARPVLGVSKYLAGDRFNLYALTLLDIQTGNMPQDQSWRVGPGFEVGFIGYLTEKFKVKVALEGIYDLLGKLPNKSRFSLDTQFDYSFGKSFELKAGYQHYTASDEVEDMYTEVSSSAVYFF